ncbi:MAG: hypothetical protein M0040_03965 [Actinomycetota bacterium]|nr:hypothetical protein [Actinomycetota bacterium]
MAARPQDAPPLIVTPGYVGPDRRAPGLAGRLRRERFGRVCTVRGLLTLALAVVAVTAVVGVALSRARREPVGSALAASVHAARSIDAGHGRIARSASHVGSTVPPTTVPPTTVPPTTVPPTTVPPTTVPPTTVPPTTVPPTTVPPPASAAASAPAPPALTPQQLGAEALALVRYPWQKLPGYSIEFEPSSDAPAPGFEGNTTFTWGQPGGTSVLYVFPGETVQQLAGITAFEIGHEVDAAAVEPQGGHTQIENILGIHPASWAPNCDCAEQGFLSGWYAAAFSDYWSPGVGQWSSLAPMPTGAVLAAVEPWLNPTVP